MKVYDIFDCNKKSLSRWVNRYRAERNIKRHSRNSTSYKVKNKHIKYALELLKDNKHSTMEYLAKKIKEKYKDFDITPQHYKKYYFFSFLSCSFLSCSFCHVPSATSPYFSGHEIDVLM